MSDPGLQIEIEGTVQGVGFRPFVHRVATELGLEGSVRNDGSRVVIEAAGPRVGELESRLRTEHPSHARVTSVTVRELEGEVHRGETPAGAAFQIVESRAAASVPAIVPDLVTCTDCLREVRDPASRYHGYPFTNCTHCGPRYSIVERLPYDRAHTTMAGFPMCDPCRAAYEDPADRRFHAQPTACPRCGPCLRLTDPGGKEIDTCDPSDPIAGAVETLKAGGIVALKGLGGFQLLVDATDRSAVARLRERKHRPHKPLAVLAADLDAARGLADIDECEAALLSSPAGPIVILEGRSPDLPETLAPDSDTLGVLLPTTPLHHLLIEAWGGGPLVCTSGNRSEEPIQIDDGEAVDALGGIADRFLLHDRPIGRAVDDSVARVIDGEPQWLRIGRGVAPLVIPLDTPVSALACGAHSKSCLVVAGDDRLVVGQHVGDLENARSVDALARTAEDLCAFFAVRPTRVACDLHPDYASTHFARDLGPPVTPVAHHRAHALAALLEHERSGPALAVCFDGAGLGPDGTVWGGEFLRVSRDGEGCTERVAYLRPFRLPGGDSAARDADRSLDGLRWEIPALRDRVGESARALLSRELNAPVTTSAGRLFDGVAALLGLGGTQSFEGRAAVRLEHLAAAASATTEARDAQFHLRDAQLDWSELVIAFHSLLHHGVAPAVLAARFHTALAEGISAVAQEVGISTVVLTGGCFQNRRLTEEAVVRLRAAGHEPLLARRVPPNDGGIAIGQMVALQAEATAKGVEHVSRGTR